jgi:hypothetical protein
MGWILRFRACLLLLLSNNSRLKPFELVAKGRLGGRPPHGVAYANCHRLSKCFDDLLLIIFVLSQMKWHSAFSLLVFIVYFLFTGIAFILFYLFIFLLFLFYFYFFIFPVLLMRPV